MWQHEIIAAAAHNRFPPGTEDILRATRTLVSVPTFYMGDGERFAHGDAMGPDDFAYMLGHMPYERMGFEFTVDNRVQIFVSAAHHEASGDEPELVEVVSWGCNPDDGGLWLPFPVVAHVDSGGIGFHSSKAMKQPENIRMMLRDECGQTVHMAYGFLRAVNACNTCYRRVVPPARLNRARLKRKSEPLMEYRILEIAPGKVRNKDAGEVPWGYRSPDERAFHLCRGHFKTYTAERPLFGKYTGTFWWQAQARGSKEHGEVVKDYAVKEG